MTEFFFFAHEKYTRYCEPNHWNLKLKIIAARTKQILNLNFLKTNVLYIRSDCKLGRDCDAC